MKRGLLFSLLFLLTFVGGLACGAFGVYRMINLTRGNFGDVYIWQTEKYAAYLEGVPAAPAPCDPMRRWVSSDFVSGLLAAAPAEKATSIAGNRERLHRLARDKINDEMFRCAWHDPEVVELSRQYVQCLAKNAPATVQLQACLDSVQAAYKPPNIPGMHEAGNGQ